MLYPWFDWSRETLAAWLQLAHPLAAGMDGLPHLAAPHAVLTRTLAAAGVSERCLEQAVSEDARQPIKAEALLEGAFLRVLRFRAPLGGRRVFVLMAPHSGYAAAVLSPVIVTLLALGDVVVTDWTDARMVPLAAGRFGLAEQIMLGVRIARLLDRPADLVAISQSGPALLAMAGLLAASGSVGPASLVLIGCQLQPDVSPAPFQQALTHWPRELVAASLLSVVGPNYPGVGRCVYPAVLQLMALSLASPEFYGAVQHGLWRELAEGEAGIFHRQHEDLHSLVDVPGELLLDMLDWIAAGSSWQGSRLRIAGRRIDLAPVRQTPILTIEAAGDELVGRGQTHAIHDRLRPHRLSRRFSLPGSGHYDLFTGPRFLTRIAPVLRRFYADLAAA